MPQKREMKCHKNAKRKKSEMLPAYTRENNLSKNILSHITNRYP